MKISATVFIITIVSFYASLEAFNGGIHRTAARVQSRIAGTPRPSASRQDKYDNSRQLSADDSKKDDSPEKTFASYVVYKSKAAVSIKLIPPTFTSLGPKARTVSRDGGILLEFASSVGDREYDWSRKGTFMLDPTECGDILAMDLKKGNVEFFHDPNAGSEKAKQVLKKMKLSHYEDGKSLSITLQVTDKSLVPASGYKAQDKTAAFTTTYQLPLSLGEFQVLKCLISYSIPRILGFDKVWDNVGIADWSSGAPLPPPPPEYKDLNAGSPPEKF